jgi:SAM-dependent methyltransferase
MEKVILDACCGSKMFWFDKKNPNVLFADRRREDFILCDGRSLEISPDIQMDFTSMPFKDETFYLVVFDPPHLKSLGESSWMAKKYGVLPKVWEPVIKDGFDECLRVLKPNGTLIFKWNEDQIKVKDLIKVLGKDPLFGHKTLQTSKTIWMTFFKQN